ncbi:hypothetical protein [Edaphobacillus lindanitolerans]|uniref:Lipoprotein n=1 Tax=Edaphobacillus lindanitolerans TaxID=550447 RepID=A0A1U7PIA3_9BACI|nr:hypothetical protein [Edaphobacillus lindanitolerans]SIT66024.1 hypothetical protein SAMN05428946_0004 [Edaphobacillus lindanitolerans]
MKRRLMALTLSLSLIAGCSTGNGKEVQTEKGAKVPQNENEPALQIQVLKADEENGLTEENEMYQQLSSLLEANPGLGVPEDFSVHALNLVPTQSGGNSLLFFGINRLDQPIRNIEFDYTLGIEENGEQKLVLDKEHVELTEGETGSIQPAHAIPFTIDVTSEGSEILKNMTEENKIVKLENVKYELGQ